MHGDLGRVGSHFDNRLAVREVGPDLGEDGVHGGGNERVGLVGGELGAGTGVAEGGAASW